MKRKSLRTLVCALLASLALTTFAFADSGPKPLLIVRVKDAPQEPYYLDLLAEGDWDGALITQPIPVSRMHALMAQALGQDGESFFAALQ
mgnify:CR=1 FL=1